MVGFGGHGPDQLVKVLVNDSEDGAVVNGIFTRRSLILEIDTVSISAPRGTVGKRSGAADRLLLDGCTARDCGGRFTSWV